MIHQTVFPFKVARTNERLTAHGGLALMAEFNQAMGVRELTDRYIPAPGSNRGFPPSVFVDTLILLLQGGGRSLEDVRELADEEGLRALIGRDPIPQPDTLGDWLRRMGDADQEQGGLEGLDQVRTRINQRILKREKRAAYTLDVDATEITGEKAEAFLTYKGNKGYMPVLGFLYEANLCLYDEFREGNAAPGSGQKGVYLECKKRMPQGKRIRYYRADSASYQAALFNQLADDGVRYTITADQDRAVKALIAEMPEAAWQEPVGGCGYELAETIHCMEKTQEAFRLVIKRAMKRQGELFGEGTGYFYHVIATNFLGEEKGAQEVLEWHNQRGQAENFHKEVKIGFGMERMPCGQTEANAVFFRIGVIAYNLFIGLKRLTCPAAWVHHTIATFRWKLVQVAGRIVRHAGRMVLKLAIERKKLAVFHEIRRRSFALRAHWCPDG